MEWWNREGERNCEVLRGIIALLLSLAGFADRAAGLSASHRLLDILGLAEAEARGFVMGTHEFGAPAAAAPSCAAGQAERLAASFRALALMVGAMLWQAMRLARGLRRAAGDPAGLPMLSVRARRLELFPRPASPPDTS